MSLEIGQYVFYLFLALLFGTIGSLVLILFVHPFVPKVMLKSYFKEPYFSPAEIQVFTGFPFGYIRTSMFMCLAAFPSTGKKRGLTEAYKLAPLWFRRLSVLLLALLFVNFIPLVAISMFFFFTL